MKKIVWILSLVIVVAVSAFAVSCGAKAYSVSFDMAGGESIAAVEVEEGEEYTLPVPEWTGYSFEGWYLSEDYAGEPVTAIVVTGDVKVYAKWEQLGVITLDLNGGTLAEGTTLYLKSGEVIYDFMQAYVPTKSGLVFGAWFDGEAELARNTRMPQEGITLKAEYKVGYTVELWTQTLDMSGYEKADAVSGSDYIGATVTPENTVSGFVRTENADEVTSMALSEKEADNVFKLYFDRERYTIRFVANYPDGSAGEDYTVDAYYGVAVDLPYDYNFGGYFLSGWSTSANGEVEYALNYIDSIIYNKDAESEPEADQLIPVRNMALYAVWSKGYTDMFGGNDYIFLFAEDAAYAYLCRGDIYFRGEYDAASRQFNFIDENLGDLMVMGRLNEDGTFSYYNETRNGYTATLYVVGEGLIENTRLVFDEYNGVKYAVTDEAGYNTMSSGRYYLDESGYYHITFSDGELNGQTLVVNVGTTTVDNVSRPAFMVRNEAEVALGTLLRYAISDGNVVYYPEVLGITLNGFDTATMNNGTSDVSYRYIMNEDGTEFTLLSAYGTAVGVARIVDFSGTKGYMLYSADYDNTYTAEDGGTLVLDGMCNATYTQGSVTETGYFSVEKTSAFGGELVSFAANGQKRLFLITATTTGTSDDQTTTYSFVQKPLGYAEYMYQDEGSIFYAPLIVLNDTKEGWASLYGFNTETREYAFVSEGTYEYDEQSGLYSLIVVGEPTQADVSTSVVDLSKVKSIVFAVDTTTTSDNKVYYVNYWHSAVIETEDGTEADEDYTTVYVCTNIAGGKLTLAGDFAVLEQNGNRYVGTYSAVSGKENLYAIAVRSNGTTAGYIYVELDSEALTYIALDTAPYTAVGVTADGMIDREQTLQFDGKGGVVYTVGDVQYTGTFVESGTTAFGLTVYTFTADGMQFDFVQISSSSDIYFAKYNTEIGSGTYASEEAGILQLDGYGFGASYTDPEGNKYTGMYFITSDEVTSNVIVLYTEQGYFYFDYQDSSLETFSVRGREYGTYLMMDNQTTQNVMARLDGYGGLSVFTAGQEEGEYDYIDESGAYSMNADGTVSLTYHTDASTEVTLVGSLGVYQISSSYINVFVSRYEEFVRTYVNGTDWSVLRLDGYGNVVRYDAEGVAEAGTYTVITDSLLYYANAAGTDASLYVYNNAAGTIVPVDLSEHAYYTADLESLLFTKYGFAVFNGSTRYFYNVENGKVTIYLQDPSDVNANEYGFVVDADSIASFSEQLVYGGKTYYENDGFRLSFARGADNAEKYPVLVSVDEDGTENKKPLGALYFTPSGGSQFSVNGTVYVGEDAYNCVVTREETEDGYDMYITLPTAGGISYYRFDIRVDYRGSSVGSSDYSITSMQLINSLPSNSYLSLYYLVYLFYGQASANAFQNNMGEISLITDYDEAGTAGEPYLNFWFGEGSGIYDADDELFRVEKVPYESLGNNAYSATFTGVDGYKYELLFVAAYNNYMGAYGYQLFALVRLQEITDPASGLTVEVGRIVGSEAYAAGSLFSLQILKDGERLASDWAGYIGEDLYVVVREREESQDEETPGKILSTTYYKVVLTEQTGDEVGETKKGVPVYEAVTVTQETVATYYTADASAYVDVSAADNAVKMLVIGTTTYPISESAYDAQTQTYTVKTAAGATYTVQITGGTATVTEVPASEGEAQA